MFLYSQKQIKKFLTCSNYFFFLLVSAEMSTYIDSNAMPQYLEKKCKSINYLE